jgi:hypothetical protein
LDDDDILTRKSNHPMNLRDLERKARSIATVVIARGWDEDESHQGTDSISKLRKRMRTFRVSFGSALIGKSPAQLGPISKSTSGIADPFT